MAQVSTQQCLLCDKNNGAYYCYECQSALCLECSLKHGKIPALKSHTVADINSKDLSISNKKCQCITHEKDFQFYCVKCEDLICSQCVTSTHYTHHFSEIPDIVLMEREKANKNIQELKLNIDKISSLKERATVKHHKHQLYAKCTQCIGHIETVSKEIMSFIESKKSIKATKIENTAKNEQQNLEAFIRSTDSVQMSYAHILSELENILLEKNDVKFHTLYRSIQSNIQSLENIPEEPALARVPIFEDIFLYKDVMEFMESKIDTSLICQNCSVQKTKMKDLQLEFKRCKDTLQSYITLSNQKHLEIQNLSDKIRCLEGDLSKSNSEILIKNNELKEEKKKFEIQSYVIVSLITGKCKSCAKQIGNSYAAYSHASVCLRNYDAM